MREQRRLSRVRIGLAFEVTLPDDLDNEAVARWAAKIVEQAPETRGMQAEAFAVVVGDLLFVPAGGR